MPKSARSIRTTQEIARIIAAFDRSGQSAAAFARARPMSVSTLRYWLRRRRCAVAAPRLVPVKLGAPIPLLAAAPPIEIVLRDGRMVRVARGIPAEEIAALCQALETSCSD